MPTPITFKNRTYPSLHGLVVALLSQVGVTAQALGTKEYDRRRHLVYGRVRAAKGAGRLTEDLLIELAGQVVGPGSPQLVTQCYVCERSRIGRMIYRYEEIALDAEDNDGVVVSSVAVCKACHETATRLVALREDGGDQHRDAVDRMDAVVLGME